MPVTKFLRSSIKKELRAVWDIANFVPQAFERSGSTMNYRTFILDVLIPELRDEAKVQLLNGLYQEGLAEEAKAAGRIS